MKKSNNQKSNTGFRNGNLFCFNCGTAQPMNLPQPVKAAAEMMVKFDQDHKACKKTWQEPVPEPEGKTERENIDWWQENGEHGISSENMVHWLALNLTEIEPPKHPAHPCDPDDFKRCHKLLEAVPSFRINLAAMRPASPVWSKLVDNWNTLTEMLLAGKYEEMYSLMKLIGC